MKTPIEELTEGMRQLCATANRIVATSGKVSAIERDLMLEELRRLYEVTLRLDAAQAVHAEAEVPQPVDSEMLSSAVMATMAAMAMPEVAAEPAAAEAEPTAEAEKAEAEPAVSIEEPAEEPTLFEEETTKEPTITEEEAVEELALLEEELAEEPAVVEKVVAESIEPEATPEPMPEPEPQPTMEELEGEANSLLFDGVVIEEDPEVSTPVAAHPEPAAAAEPEPAPTPQPEPQPEPAQQPAEEHHQTSLVDILKRQHEEQPTQRTLAERLGGNLGLQSSSAQRKVDDLRTVININDKFSFMNELFKGNMRAYNEFIMHLNELSDREVAMAHVAEVAEQYAWDSESAAVQTFYKIFDKKF